MVSLSVSLARSVLRMDGKSIPRDKSLDAMPLTIYRHYWDRAPAMRLLLAETDLLLREEGLPSDTKLCIGRYLPS